MKKAGINNNNRAIATLCDRANSVIDGNTKITKPAKAPITVNHQPEEGHVKCGYSTVWLLSVINRQIPNASNH